MTSGVRFWFQGVVGVFPLNASRLYMINEKFNKTSVN
jgi:hypothetical protein